LLAQLHVVELYLLLLLALLQLEVKLRRRVATAETKTDTAGHCRLHCSVQCDTPVLSPLPGRCNEPVQLVLEATKAHPHAGYRTRPKTSLSASVHQSALCAADAHAYTDPGHLVVCAARAEQSSGYLIFD
jgi:hypothetical protein